MIPVGQVGSQHQERKWSLTVQSCYHLSQAGSVSSVASEAPSEI
jgi:hypothetical protein